MTRDDDEDEVAGDVDDDDGDGLGDSTVCVRLRFCLIGTAETSGYNKRIIITYMLF
jgi:hypothetical protein